MQGNNKFLFDINNFDEPDEDINEEELAPSFSEEELQAAKDEAFKQGKAEGVREEKASREQITQQILLKLQQQLSSLQSAENFREQRYEEEALKLMQNALKHLFPVLNARLGCEEMIAMIERVVDSQKAQSQMILTVPDGFTEDIEALLEPRQQDENLKTRYIIKEDSELSQGGCTLAWEDGGAVRDAQKLIENMILEVDRLLPEASSVRTNDEKDDIKEEITEPNTENTAENGEENE